MSPVSLQKIRAFTLIELLVVVSIIGLLSSVTLASLSGTRESARDSKRIQEIKQINTAIQLYMNNNGGEPPFSGNDIWFDPIRSNWFSDLAAELEPYINLPVDPINDSSEPYYIYSYRAGGFETGNDPDCNFDETRDDYTLHVTFESLVPENMSVWRTFPEGDRYCLNN